MAALDDLNAMWSELAQTTRGYKQMPQPLPAGTHWYNAQQLYRKLQTELQPPPPPSPPPSAGLVFDGRAARLSSLGACFQTPAVWDVLQFTTGDLALQPDARFGSVYSVKCGPQSDLSPGCGGPIWASDIAYTSLNHHYPAPLGQTLWYADSIQLVAPFTFIDGWMSLLQMCLGPQDAPAQWVLRFVGSGYAFALQRNAGNVTATGGGAATVEAITANAAGLVGEWVDLVTGIKYASDSTGTVDVYVRVAGGSWTHPVSHTGVPTWQYGTIGGNTVNPDGSGNVGNNDQMNVYAGFWDQRPLSQFPANQLLRRGYVIAPDLATAQASFP